MGAFVAPLMGLIDVLSNDQAQAIYVVLFLGLPVLGVMAFLRLRARMVAAVESPPVVPFFLLFAAYGALLLYIVSAMFGMWSAMHALGIVVLVFLGVPYFFIQGAFLNRAESKSGYHRIAAMLSFAFPFTLGALIGLAMLLDSIYSGT